MDYICPCAGTKKCIELINRDCIHCRPHTLNLRLCIPRMIEFCDEETGDMCYGCMKCNQFKDEITEILEI